MPSTLKRKKRGRTYRHRRRIHGQPRPFADSSPEVITFMQFLKSQGFINKAPYLQVTNYPGQGRGLCAPKQALKADQHILKLPQNCVIQPTVIRSKEPLLYDGLDDEETLMFWLYNQRAQMDIGEPCEWSTYLRLLPQTFDQLLAFTTEQEVVPIGSLPVPLPMSYIYVLDKRVQNNEASHAKLLEHIEKKSLAVELNIELFNWAYCVINTRSIEPNPRSSKLTEEEEENVVEDTIVLVPFFDFINHDAYADATVALGKKKGILEVISHVPFKKGAQLYISYGDDNSNRDLYIEYGFVHILPIPPSLIDSSTFCICPSPHDQPVLNLCLLEDLLYEETRENNSHKVCFKRMHLKLEQLMTTEEYSLETEVKFGFHWPAGMISEHKYVVRFDCNGGFTILNLNGQPVPADKLQLLTANSIFFELEVIAIYLAQTAPQSIFKLGPKVLTSFVNNPISTGPRLALTRDETLAYYRLLLILIKGLLKVDYAFNAKSSKDIVEDMKEYSNVTREMAEPLKGTFRNEVGLLLFTKLVLEQKLQQMEDILLDVEM